MQGSGREPTSGASLSQLQCLPAFPFNIYSIISILHVSAYSREAILNIHTHLFLVNCCKRIINIIFVFPGNFVYNMKASPS